MAAVDHNRRDVLQLTEVLARYGKPDVFNTDQGSQFTGAAFTSALVGQSIAIGSLKHLSMPKICSGNRDHLSPRCIRSTTMVENFRLCPVHGFALHSV